MVLVSRAVALLVLCVYVSAPNASRAGAAAEQCSGGVRRGHPTQAF